MGTIKLGSLFDGSGGFPLGGILAGIQPVWASEIEPFPIRVTTRRMPFVKHYGDVNQLRGDEIEPVDIITFGSPCTDLSIAGKREGLEGQQSGLFHQALRVIKEMRNRPNGKYPSYTFTFKPLSLTRCTSSLTKHLNIVLNTTASLLHSELAEAWASRTATT